MPDSALPGTALAGIPTKQASGVFSRAWVRSWHFAGPCAAVSSDWHIREILSLLRVCKPSCPRPHRFLPAQIRHSAGCHYGVQGGCPTLEIDQVSRRIQPKGGHGKGQPTRHEKVGSPADATTFPFPSPPLTSVSRRWIAKRICEILGSEDDVLIELCCNLIEGSRYVCIPRQFGRLSTTNLPSQPDIKSVQIQITGFLDKDTAPFCKELWNLLLSAQSSPQGVPKELLEAKKLELMQGKVCRCPTLAYGLC